MNGNIAEWTLAELVDDPLVGLLMRSDGVDRRSIEILFERVARERGTRQSNDARPCAAC